MEKNFLIIFYYSETNLIFDEKIENFHTELETLQKQNFHKINENDELNFSMIRSYYKTVPLDEAGI